MDYAFGFVLKTGCDRWCPATKTASRAFKFGSGTKIGPGTFKFNPGTKMALWQI
jgi:hypothetical protein